MDSSAALPSNSRRRHSGALSAAGSLADPQADRAIFEQIAVLKVYRAACDAAYAKLQRVEKLHSHLPAFEQEQATEKEDDLWHAAMAPFDAAIVDLACLEATTLRGLLAKAEFVDQDDDVSDEQWELQVSITRDLLAIGKDLLQRDA